MDRKTINAELRRQFYPQLVAEGFTRAGDIARRALVGPVVHVVEVQHLPRRNVFQINLGAHLLALDELSGTTAVAADTVRDYDCAWRGSIFSGFRNSSDAEFAYGSTPEEASESVSFLVSEWRRQADVFFGPLSEYPGGFHRAAKRMPEHPVHPGHMRTWARVAQLVGDGALARRIAEVALPEVPERATALRDDLRAILDS
ncbi:DUF4304 domain-containing protein [Leucobacter ruminantium]|uniref:DUF4304 domain-containing protein n=1 Tax=Leucobacter ruminantium TaxID=1289170 RepID=A0A939RXZ3_9MICO|nr:DUF4304 domain-containing protein [Leucobacter ruminantium]